MSAVIANGLASANPEQAIDFSFGGMAVSMISDTMSKSGRLMRDFSKHMTFYSNEEDALGAKMRRVYYNPTEGDSINGYVDVNGQLHYHIIKSDGDPFGYGREMFSSMVELFQQHGVDIHSIRDTWRVNGRDRPNGRQFLEGIAEGLLHEDAAFVTFTGQQVKMMGITRAVVRPEEIGATIHPVFIKPGNGDFSLRSENALMGMDQQSVKMAVVRHFKTLGLAPEKEHMAIAHIEEKFAVCQEVSL